MWETTSGKSPGYLENATYFLWGFPIQICVVNLYPFILEGDEKLLNLLYKGNKSYPGY